MNAHVTGARQGGFVITARCPSDQASCERQAEVSTPKAARIWDWKGPGRVMIVLESPAPVTKLTARMRPSSRSARLMVLQEATDTSELCAYVNGAALVKVWSRLWLPSRVRQSWEERFPELARAA